MEGLHLYLAVGLFVFTISALIFEFIDKALATLISVILLLLFGVLNSEELYELVNFKTIFLLMGMMIVVEVVRESKLLNWLNVNLVEKTKGNPLWLFILLGASTFFLSGFLSNSTVMMVLVPLTISITRGLGLNPLPYLFIEIVFSVAGGALTVVGDPTNVMIGSANNFGFVEFLKTMVIPMMIIFFIVMGVMVVRYWDNIKPVKTDMPRLFMTNMLMEKIRYAFNAEKMNKTFAILAGIFTAITILFFVWDVGLSIEFVAMIGAAFVLLLATRYMHVEEIIGRLDWGILLFFVGLFIQVGSLEKVHALAPVSHFIVTYATTSLELSLMVMWIIGLLSGFVENIPLVAMMIPVLQDVLASGTITGNTAMVWYALSLGGCLGGCGTLIGSSANIITAQIAAKEGVKISFFDYFKIGYPLTILMLCIGSVYLYFVS